MKKPAPQVGPNYRAKRPLVWMGSSRKDIRAMPDPVQDNFGRALYVAQLGQRPREAKPFHCGETGVLEIVEDYSADTYRAVYTVRFDLAVYVLHILKKKSKHGIETPQQDVRLIRERFREAVEHYREHYAGEEGKR